MNHSTRRALLFLPAVLAGVLSFAPQARAEFCWDYVDNTPAKLPVVCVRQDALMCMPSPTNTCCSYNASCAKNNGGNTGSCCTLVPPTASTPPQTMLAMHTAWHECFGNTGGNPRETGPNDPLLPYPGRGARWLAFHRQFEYDFDLAREDPNGPKHEACDPMTNKSGGCWIEHLDWHKDMIFPYGHAGKSECDTMKGVCKTRFDDMGKPFPCTTDAQCHVAGCGVGNVRPAPVTCSNCVAPPECLYLRGGGPNKGGEAPTAGCVGFKRFEADPATGKLVTPLDEIPTLDEVAKILDTNEHASFHTQVGIPFPGANFIPDVLDPVCSPRDPMFWRLHKRLDDTVRAWQKRRPMDLSVVIDRSGSMSETDSSGKSKIAMVKDAVELIAALMPDNNGSKIGMVTFSDGATPDIGLTPSAQAPAAFSPILNALPGRVGGCTSIGSGLDQAATQLTSAAAANERKGIILLTDGQENRAPCLNSVGAATPNCGSTCGGGQFDISKVGVHTQLCAIGFGQAGSLNGPLLTAVAERQGGIYIQSPAKGPNDHEGMSGQGTWLDVKDFFVKCFGQVADEFEGVDPKGTLPRRQLASDPMTYSTCDDERLTFVGGWDAAESAGNLFMQVNTPSGDLVRVDDPAIENTDASKFSFVRAPLPFKGQQSGTWRAQLIRGHSTYVNGFTTDSLPTSTSVPLVRRQIQRICPVGCDKVLYYEDGHLGAQSSYALAVQAEQQSGLLTNVTTTTDANDFKSKLESPNSWNLIVYAHQMTDQVEPYDDLFKSRACQGFGVIATDTRTDAGSAGASSIINTCLGGPLGTQTNWTALAGDGRLLEGSATLTNPGYPRFSYAFALPTSSESPLEAQSTTPLGGGASAGAIMATGFFDGEDGPSAHDQNWFMDTLVRGRSQLDDSPMIATVTTGDEGLLARVRVLPANIPAGGYDNAVVKVEIESPTAGHGVGQTLLSIGRPAAPPANGNADNPDGRALALQSSTQIPTIKQTFTLNDDGVNGDLTKGNGQWSVQVPSLAKVDGMVKLHFTADFTKNGCTTRREVVRSTFVEVRVDKTASGVTPTPVPGGIEVNMCPKDKFGNPMGWGRIPTCGPAPCTCGPTDIVDSGNGCYKVTIHVPPGSSTTDCRIGGFGPPFPVRVSPVITAPSTMNFDRCFPAPAEQTLTVSTDHGTLTGRIIEANGMSLANPVAVDATTKKAQFPIGTTVVQWTATDSANGVSTVFKQTVVVTLKDGAECCQSGQTKMEGNELANNISPTTVKPYCILAKGGDDFVNTPSKDDLIIGGTGGDSLNSGAGNDTVVGGPGADAIANSTTGKLKAYGGPDADAIRANFSASSTLYGNEGQDQLVGGEGPDTLVPGPGSDTVTGGGGNDTVILYDDCEATSGLFLDGGTGTDTLITPLSVSALRARGVTVSSFENIVINTSQRHLSDCFRK